MVYLNEGNYKGKKITHVPLKHLLWMVKVKAPQFTDAVRELKRRNYVRYSVEITKHSIDRASILYLDKYIEDSGEQEGIHSWLYRLTTEVLKINKFEEKKEHQSYIYKDIRFVLNIESLESPVLVSVTPVNDIEYN